MCGRSTSLKKFILIGIGILAAAYAGFYFYNDKSKAEETAEIVLENKSEDELKAVLDNNFNTSTPDGKMPAYESMSEIELLQEVHGMTHQKVKAEQKWGSNEVTKDKVLKLLEVVKNKEFKNNQIRSMLLKILGPWTEGDFSNAVTAHNNIWEYQDGTIGKATRLLTPAEEQLYIEKNF